MGCGVPIKSFSQKMKSQLMREGKLYCLHQLMRRSERAREATSERPRGKPKPLDKEKIEYFRSEQGIMVS